MAWSRDRIFLVIFSVYVAILVFATIGEIFDIEFILDLFDIKKLFAVK